MLDCLLSFSSFLLCPLFLLVGLFHLFLTSLLIHLDLHSSRLFHCGLELCFQYCPFHYFFKVDPLLFLFSCCLHPILTSLPHLSLFLLLDICMR
ncbi:hypothetical protein BDZ91DRAFT_182291 [Kalaharituber pfeilii]|nr:hypothetical protein BDZ91DRAFT_182291 [Kalaharituber pfeilii]